jgi:hypothetical protein
MRRYLAFHLPLLLYAPAAALLWPLACSAPASQASFGHEESGGTDDGGPGGATCPPCVTTADCSGGAQCVQLASDTYCAEPCSNGACSDGDSCVPVTTYNGLAAQVCVAPGECGGNAGGGTTPGSGGDDAGATPFEGGGAPVTGTIGSDGGTLSTLYFGVVGDTRPANYDDVAGYPTAIITQIFADLAMPAFNPPFVVATGDYQFSSSGSSSTAAQQLSLYVGARQSAGYAGVQFAAMGNHECTGATASNCGSGNTDGITANYTAFMNQLLAPIQKTTPYYAVHIDEPHGVWTAKFVFVAANAWDGTQQSWLTTTMAQATTYTFVLRHEPSETTSGPPGESGSDAILSQYPYTLLIVGHSHTFGHYTTPYPREVIIGNGGAPLTNTKKYYGFGIFEQRSDGAIVGDMIDKDTLAADSQFHFVVKPDGTLTN